MRRLREMATGLYLIGAVIAYGHAAVDVYRMHLADGATPADASFIGAAFGVVAAAGWPLYASAKVWGRWG